MNTLKNFIHGQFVDVDTSNLLNVPNPATGEVLATVPLSRASDVDVAVSAAQSAFPNWSFTPPAERARVMFRYRDLLDRFREDLATLITRENGKNLPDARGEVLRGIEMVEFACGIPSLMMGSNLANISRRIDAEMFRYPLGVAAGITPFNFPFMVPLWLYPVAIACGNTFVLKPSERTPLSAVRQAELLVEAGLPEGVFNVVHGSNDAVNRLLAHPDVNAVSFVGSAAVAQHVYKTAAAHGKRVQALAGAKNFHVVLDDAALPEAVQILISSAYGNAGERCLAGSVVLVVDGIADEFVALLADAVRSVKIGNGLDETNQLGPVIRAEHRKKVESYIESGIAEGAILVCDGRNAGLAQGAGYFLGATLFDHVTPSMEIAKEEIFGPVLSIIRVKDLNEAIDVANLSRYGNASVLYTRSGKSAQIFRERIQVGMIGVNVGVPSPMAYFPFGGWKGSLYGDLHATGKDAVEFFTDKKVITTRWID